MGWRRRAVVRSTLRWFSTTWSRTMLVFCAIATPRPHAPTPCNPFVRRFNVACTPAQPHSCLASHNFQQRRTRSSSATRATSTAHLLGNARRKCTSHTTAIAAVGSHSAGPAASCFASIVPSMLPLPFLARHAATRLAAPGCAGAAPLCCALYRTPRNTNARPARPAAFAYMMCECVGVGWCDVLMPVDMFLALGSAVVCYSVASAFRWSGRCLAFVIGCVFCCSCDWLLAHRHSQLTRRAPHTHRTHHTLTTPSITLPHLALYTHTTSTPQHIHSSHTIIPTNSPPQTRSCSRKSEMANSLVLCACGCTLCFDQVYPN
jgi:hypothetical protein